jgi:hypothetical protein
VAYSGRAGPVPFINRRLAPSFDIFEFPSSNRTGKALDGPDGFSLSEAHYLGVRFADCCSKPKRLLRRPWEISDIVDVLEAWEGAN